MVDRPARSASGPTSAGGGVATAVTAAEAHETVYHRLGGRADAPALHCLGWDAEGDTVALRYRIDGLADLTETIAFPGHDLVAASATPATAGALDVLLLTASTSYYKTVVPPRVQVPAATPAQVRMLEALLTDGLAEFAAENRLRLDGYPTVVASPREDAAPVNRPAGVLVPVGGGKDSAVTAALAVRAGLDAVAFSVNPRVSMRRTAEAVGLPLLGATRRLPSRLLALNAAGALNGHVPVTAIVASVAAVAATLTGRGDVLLANEASADEPSRTVDGRAVNHQYSKSGGFEILLRAALDSATGGATRPLSLLRPLPELLVAAAFSRLEVPLVAVNSCNRAYSTTRPRREWCGTCPKCLFVQLMLAPFVTPGTFVSATGFDALADDELVPRFGDLLDPRRKPYECVGTVEEVQLAFDLLAEDLAWRAHRAVRAYGRPGTDPAGRLRAMIDAVDTSALDERYAGALRRVLATP